MAEYQKKFKKWKGEMGYNFCCSEDGGLEDALY